MTDFLRPQRWTRLGCGLFAALIVLTLVTPASAQRRTRDATRHPGFVDGSAFAELADDDGNVIEISIQGALLKMLSGAISEKNEELGDVLSGIVSINAVVVELGDKSGDKAVRLVRSTAEKLKGDGWEQIIHVRQKDDANVAVLAHHDDDEIDGLVVLVVEGGEQCVFANIAGTIDLAGLAKIGMNFDVAGLEQISDEIMKQAVRKTGKKKSRSRSRD